MRFIGILIAFRLCTADIWAQEAAAIHGFVFDSKTGEILEEAMISCGNNKSFSLTNRYGFFSIRAGVNDSTTFTVRLIGYKPHIVRLLIPGEMRLDIPLVPLLIEEQEVIVEGRKAAEIQSTFLGKTSIQVKRMEAMPVAGGELDPIKILQLTSGVQGGNEFSNGLHVRGGSHDQNLVLLDGVPVYNMNHLFGYFSIFQPEAIRAMDLKKAGIPAEFGGRLSSVLAVSLKEGNKENTIISGGVSLISARVLVEGPILDKQGSFVVAGRRTYIDPILSLASKSTNSTDLTDVSFYDLTLKVNADLDETNRVFVSGYFGGDNFLIKDRTNEVSENWGNAAYTARWNSLWSSSLFTNLTVMFSEYRNSFKESHPQSSIEKKPNVRDKTIKLDAQQTLAEDIYLACGFSLTDHRFLIFSGIQETETNASVQLEAQEINSFLSTDWDIDKDIRITAGVRFTSFNLGDYKVVEPRVVITANLSETTIGRFSYDVVHQFIHSFSSFSLISPGEIYYPSNTFLKPAIGNQFGVAMATTLLDPIDDDARLNLNAELYYKRMENLSQIRYNFGSVAPENLQNEIVVGNGQSMGLELSLERSSKTLDAWFNYTWNKSLWKFNELNRGNSFPPTFQREHSINIMADLRQWESWEITGSFVLASGQPTTLPKGRFSLNGVFPNSNYFGMIDYGDLNTTILPAYCRFDVGANYAFNWLGGKWKLQLNIYNLFDYPNPLFNVFEIQSGKFEQITIGALPTFGINFSF